ncbi:MAG TPA: hypothetical protein VNM90_30230, partial [Haliangium sp.]|nr:hypothetical protein [Haliangium sp.]
DAGLLHLQLLPYRFPIVPLTKFFHWISEPSPSSRHALAVWLWRGAWSERHARSDAPTIRAILSEISADETSTIANLLRSVPAGIEPFELRGHDYRSAGTKIACAALASLGPQNLESGERIDVAQTIEAAGASAFLRVLHHDGDGGTENRLLHPPAVAGSLREALVRAPESRLAGHCVPPSARHALKQGMNEDFLLIRREALQSLVRDFLAQRTAMPV